MLTQDICTRLLGLLHAFVYQSYNNNNNYLEKFETEKRPRVKSILIRYLWMRLISIIRFETILKCIAIDQCDFIFEFDKQSVLVHTAINFIQV